MSVTMKTQPKLAILALSLFLAAGSAQAITLGIGSGKQVVAPTVVHSDSATEDSEADKDAGNYGPDTVAEKNTDPLEGLNRAVYSLNKGLDKAILKPVATVYTNVVPSLARQGVNNFLSYLHTPLDVLNYALQGNGERAGNAMGRFMLNTFGFGVFDLATDMGISRKQTGFGETFGVWGAPQGPYVVLPVFGGRSLRGTVGTFGDAPTDATRLGAYLEAMRALDPSVWWMDGPRQTHVSDRTGADISVVTKPVYRGFFDVCEMLSYTQLEKKQSLAQKVGRTGRLESNAIAVPFGKDAG